jgi:hypothetical protein
VVIPSKVSAWPSHMTPSSRCRRRPGW